MEQMTVATARAALIDQVQDDDRGTCCPLCKHRVRNDTKSINRWMAFALRYVYDEAKKGRDIVHLGDLLKGTPGSRGHDAALLRHWGLIIPVERPEDADTKLKGSRGLSGFYRLTKLGFDFVEGRERVPKNVVKLFGLDEILTDGPLISFEDALDSSLETNHEGVVTSGETVLA